MMKKRPCSEITAFKNSDPVPRYKVVSGTYLYIVHCTAVQNKILWKAYFCTSGTVVYMLLFTVVRFGLYVEKYFNYV